MYKDNAERGTFLTESLRTRLREEHRTWPTEGAPLRWSDKVLLLLALALASQADEAVAAAAAAIAAVAHAIA